MIEPAGTVFAIGFVAGIFWAFLIGLVATACERVNGKEPEFVEIHNDHEDGHWICPRCGQDVSFYEWRNNYCSDCGQKIDWRRIDE